MKHNPVFITIIILVMLSVIIFGILAWLGCIPSTVAQNWIFIFTLFAVLFYAYFTYKILEIHQEEFRWNRNPVLASSIKPELERKIGKDGKEEWKTFFYIVNHSRAHAVAKIDINSNVGGRPAIGNDAYSGKKWWYVPALKEISGNFPLMDILESANIDLQSFRHQKIALRLAIKVTYKRWEPKKDKPMLENPPDKWYYDHEKRIWVHEPTISENEFRVFAHGE